MSVAVVSTNGQPAPNNPKTTYTDWQEAKDVLIAAKQIWESHNITSYIYNNKGSCFCMWCWIAPKYIVIENNQPIHVEFDNIADQTCSNDDINTPIHNNYFDISYYYDKAISHAQKGIDAKCSETSSHFQDAICGGSITFGYDPILLYPTSLSLQYGPYIADAGQGWSFQCLTPLISNGDVDLSKYASNCNEFTWPEPDICTLAKETGPCKASFSRYYYNKNDDKCEPFIYGGCDGNKNNFQTLQDCESECKTNICELPQQTGQCKAAFNRYYYNKNNNKCETFIYGGCDGNSNNFVTLKDCESKCISPINNNECCVANIGKSKFFKTCPNNNNEKKCLKKKDKKSGNNICKWINCNDIGYCEWNGINGKKKMSKKQCMSKINKNDCLNVGNCIWKTGNPTIEYLYDLNEINNNEYLLFGMDINSVNNTTNGIKSYHFYIALTILFLIVIFMIYKRYKLLKEIRIMNRQQKETDPLLNEQYI